MQTIANISSQVLVRAVETTEVPGVACFEVYVQTGKLLENNLVLDLDALFSEAAGATHADVKAYYNIVGMLRIDLDGNPINAGVWEGVAVRGEIAWEDPTLLHVSLGADNTKLTELEAVTFKIMRRPSDVTETATDLVRVEAVHLDGNGDSQYTLSVQLPALQAGIAVPLSPLLDAALRKHVEEKLQGDGYELTFDFSWPSIVGWSINKHALMPNFKVIPVEGEEHTTIPLSMNLAPDTHVLTIDPIDPAIPTVGISGVYVFVERVVSHIDRPVATEQLSSTL